VNSRGEADHEYGKIAWFAIPDAARGIAGLLLRPSHRWFGGPRRHIVVG
jgi:hypothetical protein